MEQKIIIKKYSDVGTGELFMSRLFHFKDYVLSGLFGVENIKEIQNAIWNVVFDGLVPAFQSLKDLRKKWNDDQTPETEKEQLVKNVYIYLAIAFRSRFQEAAKLMGYDIGFLFQKPKNFETGCADFLKIHHRIDPGFIKVVENDRASWLSLMTAVRNDAIEHPNEKAHNYIKYLSSYMTLQAAETIFDNCWRATEDFLVIFTLDMTDFKYGSRIFELNEYQQNKNHSQRFAWFVVKSDPDPRA